MPTLSSLAPLVYKLYEPSVQYLEDFSVVNVPVELDTIKTVFLTLEFKQSRIESE